MFAQFAIPTYFIEFLHSRVTRPQLPVPLTLEPFGEGSNDGTVAVKGHGTAPTLTLRVASATSVEANHTGKPEWT